MKDTLSSTGTSAVPPSVNLSDGAGTLRTTISLDGLWDLGQGGMDRIPSVFDRKVPVPGLVDMATPAYPQIGMHSNERDAFWYRRNFQIQDEIPAVAVLKIHKAMFGSEVFLNGIRLGGHAPNFTPGYFDVRKALRSGCNELIIRVGADLWMLPPTVMPGSDREKTKYIPGIFDSVELFLCGSPHIVRLQAVPDIETQSVTIHAWVRQTGAICGEKLKLTIREVKSGQIAGSGECDLSATSAETEVRTGPIPLRGCRLWSPEDPFLYEVEARSSGDALVARFGMRSFRMDASTGRAVLNGRPYFMRGSNIALYRFFEDSERGDKPWREEWVRRLHRACKGMHWNCLRYTIGFPPEMWYRIADEEGLLIQDEFPIWSRPEKPSHVISALDPEGFNPDALAVEFTEWMQERWNHPCVVIWDACNEAWFAQTGLAIRKVRSLDYSNRPWDNGWSPVESDVYESHPYHYNDPVSTLSLMDSYNGLPFAWGRQPRNVANRPIIVNEYGWLWLNRDGTPTTLTKKLYLNLLGPNSTTEQRRHIYALYLAADTEFWRAHRHCAAVMHFCALGYSRPDGQTSDHWADVEGLTWEPEFLKYVRDAFAPVGLMIDAWADQYIAGHSVQFPVTVINDLYEEWDGQVRLRLIRDTSTIAEQNSPCTIASLGRRRMTFDLVLPQESGNYRLEAALLQPGTDPVCSIREFDILTLEESEAAKVRTELARDPLWYVRG